MWGNGGAVCGAPSGTGNINATVTVPVGGTLTFTATGTIDPAFTGTLINTAQVVPAAGTSDPTPAVATDVDPVEAPSRPVGDQDWPRNRRGRR